ncbi:MAG: hypothetical protein NZM31_01915 [Gemmatales bacterium]|nr:hypothetical protein [Gemmatales bacterium]MDW8385753.1 hypothetical protein [Gemmatales bacterium]
MSTAETTFPAVIPSPQRLPPEVTSTLAALWLSIATGLLALASLWPMALNASGTLFPDVPKADLANLGWMLLFSVAGFIVVFGLFVTWRVARRSRFGLRTLQLSLLAGLIGGTALLIGIFVLILQGQDPHPLGPTPILSGVILVLTALLPICFGIFALSYSGTSAVEEFLKATDVTEESYAGIGGTGGEEAGVVTEAAEEPVVSEAAAEPTAQVQIQPFGQETQLRQAPGGGKDTMLAGPGEMLSPDDLDRMYEGEGQAPAAGAGQPESESIFDEDDFGRRTPGASGISQSGILREASRLSTGESSIFTEINPVAQGSDIISGVRKGKADTGLSFTRPKQPEQQQGGEGASPEQEPPDQTEEKSGQ